MAIDGAGGRCGWVGALDALATPDSDIKIIIESWRARSARATER